MLTFIKRALVALISERSYTNELEKYIAYCEPQSIHDVEAAMRNFDERQRLIARAYSEQDYTRADWLRLNY